MRRPRGVRCGWFAAFSLAPLSVAYSHQWHAIRCLLPGTGLISASLHAFRQDMFRCPEVLGQGVNVCDPYLWHNIHPAATGGVSPSTSRGHTAIFLTFPLPRYNSIITQSLSPLFAFLLFLFSFLVFSAQVQRKFLFFLPAFSNRL